MSDFKSTQIKNVIKDLLKKNKMTYETVAEEFGCSVPTVKRILGQEELSLVRLLEFCELLNITLTDVETLISNAKEKPVKFTEEQQQFLVKNKSFLSYLISLYSQTPAEIAEKNKLTSRSTDKYLIGLEKQGLIKVTGKLKVRPVYKELPGLDAGPLAKAYYEKFIANGAQFFTRIISDGLFSPKKEPNDLAKLFSLHGMLVTENSYRNFAKELNQLVQTFYKLASYEEKTLAKEELKTVVLMQGYTLVENENPHLSLLENTFEPIINI